MLDEKSCYQAAFLFDIKNYGCIDAHRLVILDTSKGINSRQIMHLILC